MEDLYNYEQSYVNRYTDPQPTVYGDPQVIGVSPGGVAPAVNPYDTTGNTLSNAAAAEQQRQQQIQNERQNTLGWLFSQQQQQQAQQNAVTQGNALTAAQYGPRNVIQAGPVTMAPNPNLGGAMAPLTITGGSARRPTMGGTSLDLTTWLQQFLQQILNPAAATGTPSGPANWDTILQSIMTDLAAQNKTAQRGVTERFAGMGRSVAGSVPQEALANLSDQNARQQLAGGAAVQTAANQSNQAYAQINANSVAQRTAALATILPTILQMIQQQQG